MPVIQVRAYEAIIRLAAEFGKVSSSLERIATALEKISESGKETRQ